MKNLNSIYSLWKIYSNLKESNFKDNNINNIGLKRWKKTENSKEPTYVGEILSKIRRLKNLKKTYSHKKNTW